MSTQAVLTVAHDPDSAPTFEEIRPKIIALLKDKILVGHAVYNDLSWIGHRHPYEDFRDTSLYYPLRKRLGIEREGEYPGLKKLYKEVFGEEIQTDIHCPVRLSWLQMDIELIRLGRGR